jgi:uncharacterized protein YbjT (DUF2867 family)
VNVRIAVAGASGFVGRALVPELVARGHAVVALARHDPGLPGATGFSVDVGDEDRLGEALAGCEVAYYLVHSLAADDFRSRDHALAMLFGRVAAGVGVRRIVYLGGLGDDPRSEHLLSRQEVGGALGAAGVPVVELRAAVVLGAGSISFEILRYLTERLPVMVCPRWVATPIQPIALRDLIGYLVGAVDVDPGVYEIGGADVTTYRDMILTYARVRGLHRRRILDIPYLTPRLSSYWVDLVTPVNQQVSHSLIESLVTEVVVGFQEQTDRAFGIEPLGLGEAIAVALAEQGEAIDEGATERTTGLVDGVYSVRIEVPLAKGAAARVDADLSRIGGDYRWYGLPFAWRLRAVVGRLVGERWQLALSPAVESGAPVDWWLVARRDVGRLVLRSDRWFPGDAWLGWAVVDDRLVQVGALRARGLPGFLYWKVLAPLHHRVFSELAGERVRRALVPTSEPD